MVIKISKNTQKNNNIKKYIGLNVSEDIKLKWQNFADNHDYSTVSKLIREAVNFYVDSHSKVSYLKNLSKLSLNLKGPLTSIKGFSQLLIEGYSDKLNVEVLLRIKEIFYQSIFLEKKIDELLTDIEPESEQYEVLIVEDDTATIMVLTDFFELRGHVVKGVSTGENGLDELTRTIPKVILLDIVLPDIDGYEICKKIKFDEKLKELKDIPVYYITAIPETDVSKRMDETGADGYFLKPFDFRKFEVLFEHL